MVSKESFITINPLTASLQKIPAPQPILSIMVIIIVTVLFLVTTNLTQFINEIHVTSRFQCSKCATDNMIEVFSNLSVTKVRSLNE